MLKVIHNIAWKIVCNAAKKNNTFIVPTKGEDGICEVTGQKGKVLEAPHLCYKKVCVDKFYNNYS